MTTSNSTSLLKDVVAYVDVWSTDKSANYSKPFIQQLHDMGAQVSKTFNKHVTHVIFNNGHSATWKKAKASHMKLVSVLWVGRCYEDGIHVDEDSYPAINDETNPNFKYKKHRCMQPRDSPQRTPENDKRMRKKLDKMMKDLAPHQPLITDVSPIIIDEENGLVFSPSWKRSDYMAQRLKDMKEKWETLSPTASQAAESSSSHGLKPSLGNSPSVSKLLNNHSDDDSSTTADEVGLCNKKEGATQLDFADHDYPEHPHRKNFEKPWLSPRHDVSKHRHISPLKFPDFEHKEEEEGSGEKKLKRVSLQPNLKEKYKSLGLKENYILGKLCDDSKNFGKVTRMTEKLKKRSNSTVQNTEKQLAKFGDGKQNFKSLKAHTETETFDSPETVNLPGCHLSSALPCDAFHEDTSVSEKLPKKTSKNQKRQSVSSHQKTFSLSRTLQILDSGSADKDDGFESFLSPAKHDQKTQLPWLSSLPDGQFPFELDPVPNKRKSQKSECTGSKISSVKKRKVNNMECFTSQLSDPNTKPQSYSQQEVKECLPVLCSSHTRVPMNCGKRKRQSPLPSENATDTTKDKRASAFEGPTKKPESPAESGECSTIGDHLLTLGRGNDLVAADGSIEVPPEDKEKQNKHASFHLPKMVNTTKAMRTLVMTSLPTEKQHTVAQVVKALGGFSIVDQVCESTTHVVSGGHRRTLNILLGIARGCWILSFEWVLWSLEKRQWIPEEPYELCEQFPAAQICRLQRHLSAGEHQQDLFQDQPVMFVSPHSQPPAHSLVELIQLCGGTVCKTVRQAGICIGTYNGRRPEGSRILSEQWVLDSITNLKQLSYDNYELE